ncbi:hypothetical protein, partial [Microbacterium sp. MYb24]
MSPSTRARADAARLQIAGAIAAVTGLTLLALPLPANAVEPTTYPVTIDVSIDDGASSAALSGANVIIRTTDGSDAVVASGTTGSNGTVTLDVAGEPTSYIVDAVWPGALGDLEATSARREFLLGNPAPVSVPLRGTFGTVTGVITAAMGVDGGVVVISSGGVAVQRIPLAAGGGFTSGALPTTSAEDYAVSLVPAAGFELAAQQPSGSRPFSVPAGQFVSIGRHFDVVPQG